MFLKELEQILLNRAQKKLLRSLKTNDQHLIDFASNDYLGFSQNQELKNNIQRSIQAISKTGSGGSRLLTGNITPTEKLESLLAYTFQAESALIFNSGYSANTGLISCIASKNDLILYDQYVHASIREGIKLSDATAWKFQHNNIEDLKKKLDKSNSYKHVFIITEALYSMEGDLCPISELVELKRKHRNIELILDESHSTGTVGKDGLGLALEKDSHKHFLARVVTFGKALGIQGACVLGSKVLKKYLVNFSKPFIYTTAPSPILITSIKESLHFLQQNTDLVSALHQNIDYYLTASSKIDLFSKNNSPIQYMFCKGNEQAQILSQELLAHNILALPILSPTVPEGKERIRINLHSFNSKQEIDLLLEKSTKSL